jgi:four helix bundle protein
LDRAVSFQQSAKKQLHSKLEKAIVRGKAKDVRTLKVWEKSHQPALDIYKLTDGFPNDERYGMTSQIRKACFSIPTNIAEGSGRQTGADFNRFLSIAMGSASELVTLPLLAKDLDYLRLSEHQQLNMQIVEIKKKLAKFINWLRADS